MSQLFTSSLDFAQKIKEKKEINYKELFEDISIVSPLKWLENRDLYELQITLRTSLSTILESIYLLKCNYNQTTCLEYDEMLSIVSTEYFNQENYLQFLLELDTPLISEDAYKKYISEEKNKWKRKITGFTERAEHYADLSKLARIHQDGNTPRELLQLAASNLLSYGGHKDMYLDGVLQSIKICHQAGSQKTDGWIRRIAPIVENVRKYTDGDHTRYFPGDLAEILVTVNPRLLYKYYFNKAKEEKLFLAQDIFQCILDSLQFKNEEDVALATTALDEKSFKRLRNISKDKKGAKRALEIIENYFGKIEYKKENNSSHIPEYKQEVKDYSLVEPEKLDEYITNIETKWDQNDYLVSWTEHWLNKKDADKRQIYQIITSIIDKNRIHNVDAKMLDIIYPLAYELDNKAFDYLCWAQANDGGWSPYFTDKAKAKERWGFVKEHYPDRYMEFFNKSISCSGKRYSGKESYCVPLPRSSEFLAMFNNLETIEDITEAGIRFAELLMADLELPACKWLDSACVDEMDILFQRLLWPSPLVRERSATSIGYLLAHAPNKEHIFNRLLSWIKNQKLESTIAIGLLPLIKTAEKRDKVIEYINLKEIIDALPMTSIVIEKLIEELSRLLNQRDDLERNRRNIEEFPLDYLPNDFFNKFIKGFLAPIYLQRAEEIQQQTGMDFIRQWSFTSSEMMKECEFEEKVGDAMDFMGGNYSPILFGMSTNLSEVYRSAFLRVLQQFYEWKLISEDYYLQYALATLPIELSYWKVKPDREPKWWPKLEFKNTKNNDSNEIFKIGYQKSIEQIIKENNQTVILGIDGTMEPSEGWINGVLDTSLALVAFGYKTVGPNMPTAKEVAQKVLYRPKIFIQPSLAKLPFNFLESPSEHISTKNSNIDVDDLVIYPLVARNHDLVIGLWQWFRDFSLPFGLYGALINGANIKLEEYGWSYFQDKKRIASSKDWLEGLKERHDKDLYIPHGHYIEADLSFIKSYLHSNSLRLGYILKIVYKYRKYSHDDVQTLDDYQLIGVSNIIV